MNIFCYEDKDTSIIIVSLGYSVRKLIIMELPVSISFDKWFQALIFTSSGKTRSQFMELS